MNALQKAPAAPLSFDGLLAKKLRPLDPYIVWALVTQFRQFIRGSSLPKTIDFLLELTVAYAGPEPTENEKQAGAFSLAQLNAELGQRSLGKAVVPRVYEEPIPGSGERSRYVSLRLEIGDSATITEVFQAVSALLAAPGMARLQIGFPRPPNGGSQPPASNPPQAPFLPVEDTSKVLLGVMDDACPFAHEALLDLTGKNSRVRAVWAQSQYVGDAAIAPGDLLGYGWELQAPAIAHWLTPPGAPRYREEDELYQQAGTIGLPRTSHGAAVTALFAGKGHSLPTHSPASLRWPPAAGAAPANVDCEDLPAHLNADEASAAPIVAVQFPREQISVAGSRWMVVRALDGLRYIARQSTTGAARKTIPVVINLSYGGVASGHDGTGLLESAMSELASTHPAMAIVLSAGNSHGNRRDPWALQPQARLPSGRHAECAALKPKDQARFRLYVPPNKPIETYLEIWFREAGNTGPAAYPDESDLEIELLGPTASDQLKAIPIGGVRFNGLNGSDITAAVIAPHRVAQSTTQTMALVVLAATQISSSRQEVNSGPWVVTLTNKGKKTWNVQAWVERDLLPGGARRHQAARLLAPQDNDQVVLTDENSLTSIATGSKVYRVGALTAWPNDQGVPQISAYSSQAERQGITPEFGAIADETPAHPGIRVAGQRSGSVARFNGTSMAAPQAARWIANQLAGGMSIKDIDKLIAATAELHPGRARKAV